MASFYLINTVLVGSIKIFAGDLINDAVEDAAAIRSAGGLLWPSGEPVVAAAALKAQNARLNRGADEKVLDSIMQQAVDAVQLTVDGSDAWRAQSTWVIEPTGTANPPGNDSGAGSAAAPLRTIGELNRRLGRGMLLPGALSIIVASIQLISVSILSTIPASDPIDIDAVLPANTLLAFVGTPVTVRSGIATAGTVVKAPATNVRSQLEDTVTPPTAADEGMRFRVISGANAGQISWGAKFSGGLLSMSSWSTPTMTPLPDCLIQQGITTGTFVSGDPYVVETSPQVTLRNIDIKSPFGQGASTGSIVGFANLEFQSAGGALQQIVNVRDTVIPIYKACKFNGTLIHDVAYGRAVFLNCCFKGPGGAGGFGLVVQRSGPSIRGGLCLGTLVVRPGSIPAFDDDFMTEGGTGYAILGSGALFGAIACFNSTVGGFRVQANGTSGAGASVNTQVGGSGVNRLWGSGNAGGGVEIGSGCVMDIQTGANATITGSVPGTNDFILSGATSSRAWDETAAAGLGSQTLLIVNSWANYNLAVAGGGFGGNAKNYERSAAILKR